MGRYAHDGAPRRGDGSSAGLPVATGLRLVQAAVLALALLPVACNRSDQEVKVYRVVKAPLDSGATPNAPTAPDAPNAPDAAPTSLLPGSVPSNWEPQPPSQMRQASFLVHGENGATADISLVTLGPSAGNVLDNVNRWLSQLAQPPITAEKLSSTVQQLATGRGDVAVVDLTGQPENGDAKKDGRIVAAIASDDRGTAFYKMRGNSELAEKEKENFLKWVRSSREGSGIARLHDTAPAPPSNDSAVPKINWDVPGDWSQGQPSAMRYASFTAGSETEKADVSVITFPGEGGSDLDNVNRWRQQIGLPAIQAGELPAMILPMTANALSFSTVDLVGDNARTIAGWIRHEGRVWFFKLTGPKEAVEREKPKFVKFIQSVRF